MNKKSKRNNIKETINFDSLSAVSITDVETPETYPSHWHNASEFTVALKSGCSFRINDTVYRLEAGDVLLVWPQQIHEIVNVPQGGVIFTQFSSEMIDNNPDIVSMTGFLYEQHHLRAKKDPELTSFISERINDIKNIRNSSHPLAETKCKVCIYDILLRIGDHVLASGKVSEESDNKKEQGYMYIHAACSYIHDNSADNITQADAADHVGLSTYYFSKLFNRYMHMTFPAYLSNIRVKNAIRLLSDESLSITECAFRAGFQSTTSFNKAFHDITGYSPREYRKLYR